MPKWVGLWSRWGCIVSIADFDWGCISFSKGWGSIQEWGCIDADIIVAANLVFQASQNCAFEN